MITKLSAQRHVRVPVGSLTSLAPINGGEALYRSVQGTTVSAHADVFGDLRERNVDAWVNSAQRDVCVQNSAVAERGVVTSIPFATRMRGRGYAALNCLLRESHQT